MVCALRHWNCIKIGTRLNWRRFWALIISIEHKVLGELVKVISKRLTMKSDVSRFSLFWRTTTVCIMKYSHIQFILLHHSLHKFRELTAPISVFTSMAKTPNTMLTVVETRMIQSYCVFINYSVKTIYGFSANAYSAATRGSLGVDPEFTCDGTGEFLPPATKLGQSYVFTGVCDSVHRGGVPDQVHHPPDQVHPPGPGTHPPRDQVHPPDQVTPRDQVHPPGAEHAGRYGQRTGGTHPTGMQSCN